MTPNLKPLRLGLIGAGRWARIYAKTIATLPDVCIARIARRSSAPPDFAPAGVEFTTDWKAVATARDLDGVIIATPPALHAEMALAAVQSGLPVLVEKPLAMNLGEAQRLRDASVKHATLVMVEHTHLFSPAFREIMKIATGLGPVRGTVSEAGNWGPFRSDIPILWDWGAHDVAMCMALTGAMPARARARIEESRMTPDGPGETVSIHLEFPGGVISDIRLSNMLSGKTRFLSAYFDSCCMLYDDVSPVKLARLAPVTPPTSPDRATAQPVAAPAGMPLTVAVREFCAAIRIGATDRSSLDLGVNVVDVLEQCARSM
ncbi:MAG: Gfo/Idh/MocA family oxidoreductase [bacterium]